MAKLLLGKDVAAAMNEESRTRAAALTGKWKCADWSSAETAPVPLV